MLNQLKLPDNYRVLVRGLGSKNREVLLNIHLLLAELGSFETHKDLLKKENGVVSLIKTYKGSDDNTVKESTLLLLNNLMEDS